MNKTDINQMNSSQKKHHNKKENQDNNKKSPSATENRNQHDSQKLHKSSKS